MEMDVEVKIYREKEEKTRESSDGSIVKRLSLDPVFNGFSFDNICDVLKHRAEVQQNHCAFIRLPDDETNEVRSTYHSIYVDALIVARVLAKYNCADKRVLLLLDPGLEYTVSLFGVFMAGAIAIPSFPPNK